MEEHTNNDTKVSKTSLSKRLKQHHSATDKPGLDDNKELQPKVIRQNR